MRITNNLVLSLFLLLSLIFFLANASDSEPEASHRPPALSCNEFNTNAVACVDFVSGVVPKPTQRCCAGLQQLARRANTTANRRAICRCLKQAVKNFPGIQDKYLSKIPGSCNVNLGFPISMKTNCNSIA